MFCVELCMHSKLGTVAMVVARARDSSTAPQCDRRRGLLQLTQADQP